MNNVWRAAAALVALSTIAAPAAAQQKPLPTYVPHHQVSGVLRSSGDKHMARLMRAWEIAFHRYQPGIEFADALHGTASGMYGLEMRIADVALMGRPINPFERYGTYERSWVYPVELEVATGSVQTPGASPAYAIFVNKANPLSKITIKQLDGVFGAQRGGGWQALSWVERAARPASANIRTWGQLGIRGALADKPIHVYGQPLLGTGAVSFFQARVLHGGEMWNEDLREYDNPATMLADLRRDPYGIAYAPLTNRNDGVKPIMLADTAAGPYVPLTAKTVADRSYPLARPVYINYTIDNERSQIANPRVDPKVEEFLRFVLSAQGQAIVARDGTFLPLSASVVQRQLHTLQSHGVPPEKALLGE